MRHGLAIAIGVLSMFLAAPAVQADTLYGVVPAGGDSRLYTIDPLTGTATPVGSIGFVGVSGIDFHPVTGVLYGVGRRPVTDELVLITIDTATGAGTEIGPTNFEALGYTRVPDISFRGMDSVLYATLEPNDDLGRIDIATGAGVLVGTPVVSCCGNALAFGPTDVLVHADNAGISTFDQITGVATPVAPASFAGFPPETILFRPNAMDFHPSSRIAFASINDGVGGGGGGGGGPNYLATLDPTTGVFTHVGLTVPGLDALAWKAEACRPMLYGAAYSGADGPARLFRVDPYTGDATLVGPIGFDRVGAMDFHPATRRLYAVAERPASTTAVLIEIDPGTGLGTEIGPLVNTPASGHFDVSFRNGDGTLFVLAWDPSGSALAEYTVDLTTGLASYVGPSGTLAPGNAIGFTAGDDLLHADVAGGGTYYTVDQLTGASTAVGSLTYDAFPALAGPKPNAMDFAPGSSVAAMTVNDGGGGSGPTYLGRFDPATGSVTHVGPTAGGLDALAWRFECDDADPCTLDLCVPEPEVELYGTAYSGFASATTLYRIDAQSGAATAVGPVGFDSVGAIAFEPRSGALYGVGHRPGTGESVLITIDPSTGKGTEVGLTNLPQSPYSNRATDIAFRESDGTLFAYIDSGDGLFTIDTATGAATLVGPTNVECCGNAIEFSESGRLLHANDIALNELDQATGNATFVASYSYVGFPALSTPRPNAMSRIPGTSRFTASINDANAAVGPNYLAIVDTSGTVDYIGTTVTGLDGLAWRRVPHEDRLYGAARPNGVTTFFRIDPSDGTPTAVGPIGFDAVSAMDFHPTTGVLYATGKRLGGGPSVLITVDPATGAGSEIGPTGIEPGNTNVADLSFLEGGAVLYAYVEGGDQVGTVDLTTGAVTLIGPSGAPGLGNGMAFGTGDVLYHGYQNGLGILSKTTGAEAFQGAFSYVGFPALAGVTRPNAMDLHNPSGEIFVSVNDNAGPGSGSTGPSYLARLDPVTRNVVYLGDTERGLDALAWYHGRGHCIHEALPDLDGDETCDLIDNCPQVSNPGQGPAPFGQTIYATATKTHFVWMDPLDYSWVRGEFTISPDIGTFAFDTFGNDSGSQLFDPLLPATPGSGLWYLMRPMCEAGSWTSGGPSEAPGRDVALDTCMPGGVTFPFSGAPDVFVAPCSGTFQLEAWGAQGGGPNGGLGGYAAGTITLSAGDTLEVRVGGQSGWNGGGAGWAAVPRNGGGATDFRRGGSGLADRVLVAGGGGAGGSTDLGPFTGGAGGGGSCAFPFCGGGGAAGYGGPGAAGALGGGAGNTSCHSGGAGGGGFQSGGGGSCNTCYSGTCGASGTLGQGGAGDTWENGICYSTFSGTHGGGGGFYGGGGSSVGNCGGGGGGGGSSWTGSLGAPSMSGGVQSGDGIARISW